MGGRALRARGVAGASRRAHIRARHPARQAMHILDAALVEAVLAGPSGPEIVALEAGLRAARVIS